MIPNLIKNGDFHFNWPNFETAFKVGVKWELLSGNCLYIVLVTVVEQFNRLFALIGVVWGFCYL